MGREHFCVLRAQSEGARSGSLTSREQPGRKGKPAPVPDLGWFLRLSGEVCGDAFCLAVLLGDVLGKIMADALWLGEFSMDLSLAGSSVIAGIFEAVGKRWGASLGSSLAGCLLGNVVWCVVQGGFR